MRIEIFVVMSELEKNNDYEGKNLLNDEVKTDMCMTFGGLTETGIETGYWYDGKTIYADTVKRWIIYTNNKKSLELITEVSKRIKRITSQKV